MIFTLYYMYATVLQWWRLRSLSNKLNGTLNAKNALLLSHSSNIHYSKRQRSIENLLFHVEDRIACTVVPKQNVNLSHWILFPKDPRAFPIHIEFQKSTLNPPFIYLLIRTLLENYTKHDSETIQVEHFGEPVAWKAASKFEILLKTDLENLTKLVQCFWNSAVDINHDLEMLEIETVNIDGNANKIKYDRKYSMGETVKYSHSPVHWKKFASDVKELYLKIRENSNPKIKIENGASKVEDHKKVPIYEVKPIKKESKKQTEDKNTLDVSGGDHRRHKSVEKRDKLVEDKHKTDRKTKDDPVKIKELKTEPTKTKVKTTPAKSDLGNKISEKCVESSEAPINKTKVEPVENFKSSIESTSKTIRGKDFEKDKNKERFSKSKEIKGDRSKEGKIDTVQTLKPKGASAKSIETKGDQQKEIAASTSEESNKSKEKDRKSKSTLLKDERSKNKGNEGKEKISIRNTSKMASEGLPNHKDGLLKSKVNITNFPKVLRDSKSKLKFAKPPNILVYADSVNAKENVKVVLNSVINREKYIVYDLPTNVSTDPVWCDATVLVVICGATTPEVTSQFLHYLVNGGQLLCLCSDLLHSILNVFSTAEVREHELVRFSYGEWKRVKMMHHIFCYQASPAKKQFSKDSVESNNSNGSSPVAPRTPSSAEIQHNGKNYTLQVQVLGTEETWQTPSLLLANVKNSNGRAIFSQVHLEIDPLQYEEDENKYIALKDSNNARLEILTDILTNRLDIDCMKISAPVVYTPGYFLGRHDMKMEMFNECKEIVDNTLKCKNISVVFCGKNVDPGESSATRLPVMLFSCPSSFSTVEYFSALNTDAIGRLIIYADILKSSHYLLDKTLKHGLVVIPRQQSGSIGRSSNIWLSPPGSACFSLQLHVPLSSPLGRMLTIVQHLVTVAVIEAIKKNPGYEHLDIGLKWPNDIYVNRAVKIGGLLTTSVIGNRIAVLNIGCGLNLDNSDPTIALNDYIDQYNTDNKTDLQRFSHEKYFAMVFNEIENLYDFVQNDNLDDFYNLYYKNWIHQDAEVKIRTEDGLTRNATVIGIDDFGFLKVKLETGETTVVHPDGNSFDMIKGLIAPKSSFSQ